MKKVLALVCLMAAALACEPAARTIDPGHGPVSSAITATHSKLLIASEDHGQLLIVDRATKKLVSRVDVGDSPAHVIQLSDGTAAVSTRFGNSVVIVDVDQAKVLSTIPVGVEPMGMVELQNGNVAVVLAGEAALAVVDVKNGAVTQKIQLADKDPRAVALLADGSLYVSHMATGAFSRVHLDTGVATRVDVSTRNDFGPRMAAEHLRTLTVDDNTGTVLTAHTQANVDTVRAPIDDPGAPSQGQNCGYSGCQQELPAVTPGITEVDPNTDTVVIQSNNQQQGGQFTNGGEGDVPVSDCIECGGGGFQQFTPNPPSVLNPHESRLTGTHIQNPTALALFDGGRGQLIVNLGSKNAVLLRRELHGVAQDVIATVKLGNGAQSVAISDDGATAYVWNQFDRTISEIALPKLDDTVDTASKFVPDASGKPVAAPELGVVPELASKTIDLGLEDKLTPEQSIGRKLFHDATDSRISANAAVSCATCHPDGRNDGRTWQFVFGPRNTPQLGGSILDTAPFHWPGDVPTVPDLNTMTVLPFMGGTGLDAGSFEYVAAYIDTIKAAPTVTLVRPELTEQEQRGEALFYSDATQCSTCHAGAHYTDNLSHDIGTQASPSDIRLFQTPVLHGLARSAPYLHDGSQASLEDLVQNVIKTDKMGKGSQLTQDQADDLVAYLRTL